MRGKKTALTILHYGLSFAIIGGVLILLMDQIVMPIYVKHGQSLKLPDVREVPYHEASQLLRSKGFVPVKDDSKYNPEYRPGIVLDQQPRAHSPVKTGRRVYLTVSAEEKFIKMPGVIGKTVRGARLEITRVGLSIDTLYQTYSDTFPEGVITDQSVKPGGMIRRGSPVGLTVSQGRNPHRFHVPDVTGASLQDAREKLRNAGLEVGEIQYIQNRNLVPYTTLEQSIPAGTTLHESKAVDLVVSVLEMKDIFNEEMR